jgi:hypothetical protein
MKPRILWCLLVALLLALTASPVQARYYQPQTGRFQTMDSYEGSQSDPQSLHKYLYAQANPVNRVDPSGHLSSGESISVSGIQGLLARQILPTVIRIPGHIAARGTVGYAWIIGGIGAAVQTGYQHFSETMREEARLRVRARVEEQQQRSGERILYHYTESWSKAVSIASSGLIKASEAYTSGNFTFPPGAYGTDIPPWSMDYTQSDLSALFYGGVRTHPMPFFVAFEGPDFFELQYSPFPHQFVRPADEGDYVPVKVVTHGPNLMRP